MTTPSIRALVARSVGRQWTDFAAAHPRLAAVLDEQMLVDHVVERLGDDPAYQEAMADAAAAGRVAGALHDLVERFVGRFFRQLLR